METRANYVAVGIFTVLAILAAFIFVYWTARLGSSGETALLRFRIAGSAAGLGRGSAVLFNGVKVGDIKR
ncbi:MAG: MCE family protein, partial [Rhizobiaceae bacterium]